MLLFLSILLPLFSAGEPLTAAASVQPQSPVVAATKEMSEMKIEVTPSSPTRLMAESPGGSPLMQRRSPSPNALVVTCTIPKAKSLVRTSIEYTHLYCVFFTGLHCSR